MDAPEISVYGEAKGEYTRQLCVFLLPCLESYILELLDSAKKDAPSPQKVLWHFQSLLQAIPDWNQDKVIRETDKIQKECRCDYLEELLTAVFIAHTKVLSAIRLTTKQKKLQITIPKLDHFIHRVLIESARTLWTNAYLFADTNSIEKQKNLRQVSSLLQEAILQAIRGLLPVKSILREYLHEDDEEEEAAATPKETVKEGGEESAVAEKEEDEDEKEEAIEKEEVAVAIEEETVATPIVLETPPVVLETPPVVLEAPPVAPQAAEEGSSASSPPMIFIDTKPSVTFSQEHIMFDSNSLEANEIQDLPFAEAELRPPEEDEDDNDLGEIDSLNITDEVLPMDAEEIL